MADIAEVLARLEEHKEYAIKELNLSDDQVLGVFLYGSQNYGLDDEYSDIDSQLIVMPTFSDLCLGKPQMTGELKLDGEHIKILDIRRFRDLLIKNNFLILEILFTDYYVLNDDVLIREAWQREFLKNREIIARCDPGSFCNAIYGNIKSILGKGKRSPKVAANLYRLYFMYSNYLMGESFSKCLKLNAFQAEIVKSIKTEKDEALDTGWRNAVEMIKVLQDKQQEAFEKDTDIMAIIDAAITNIIAVYCNLVCRPETVDVDKFLDSLSTTEQKAFKYLTEQCGVEGNISLAQAYKPTQISRPVWVNLFAKMKVHSIAEIRNQGVKGTHIKFLHPGIRQMIMQGGEDS